MKQLLYKVLGEKYSRLAISYRQAQTYCYSVLHPYHYDASRYAETFLEEPCDFPYFDDFSTPVDRVIYIFWTGDNEITPNRLEGIKSLERVSGIEVKLITPKNLPEYIKNEDPLPDAYNNLSLNHRSDYLRSYFMYHYGGGYADIKTYFHSWVSAFDKLNCLHYPLLVYRLNHFFTYLHHIAAICRVVISRRCTRIDSFFRLAYDDNLAQIS